MRFSELHPPAIQKSLVVLQCSNPNCRKETHAACNCGVSYVPKEFARNAIIADPSKSNRTIAKETGASLGTVNTVRKELGEQGCSPERKGADGKTYRTRTPEPRRDKTPALADDGWSGFENRVYAALERLRLDIPDILRKDPKRIEQAFEAAFRRSLLTEKEESAEP